MTSENPLLNPLKKIPGISITLPTRAILYDSEEVSQEVVDAAGEIHIRPMSSRDELVMRTSDLILNGQAFSHVCRNCIEGINQPLELFQADHDAILVGLRIATYGDLFPIKLGNIMYDPENEESKEILEFDLNLRGLLQEGNSLKEIEDYQIKIESTGQVVTIQPLRVKAAIDLVHRQLEENAKANAKKQASVELDDTHEETLEKEGLLRVREVFSRTTKDVTDIQDDFLMNAIRDVDGNRNIDNIMEWYQSPGLTAKDFFPIRSAMEQFVDLGVKQTMTVTDPISGEKWDSALPINPFDFFVSGPDGVTYPV
jgi:hypothetical protein